MNKIKIFKKVTGKCQIKGCRCNGRRVDTFYVSASDGFGPSVIICEECIRGLNRRLNDLTGVTVVTGENLPQPADQTASSKKEPKKNGKQKTEAAEE
ncbi:MAG: hypothetical protein IKU60_03795 [Clostridia bacterium]|nr:hypothetical protein [Clostridia bacterium]